LLFVDELLYRLLEQNPEIVSTNEHLIEFTHSCASLRSVYTWSNVIRNAEDHPGKFKFWLFAIRLNFSHFLIYNIKFRPLRSSSFYPSCPSGPEKSKNFQVWKPVLNNKRGSRAIFYEVGAYDVETIRQ